jgi:hypothetical protein
MILPTACLTSDWTSAGPIWLRPHGCWPNAAGWTLLRATSAAAAVTAFMPGSFAKVWLEATGLLVQVQDAEGGPQLVGDVDIIRATRTRAGDLGCGVRERPDRVHHHRRRLLRQAGQNGVERAKRRTVIDSNEGLRELELRKLANLSASIASGFQARGLGDLHATLAADAG